MELLKINTAGSVDDGKSTLIGRFLYDNNALTIEQEELVRKKTKEKGLEDLDFSVITDGLIAEREQGITIDVAHIYFSSAVRKFIIADSPGHIEYTRNMVTGASNSDLSIILIDARKGLLEQTHRHYFISRLLRLQSVVFCINKMDLVDYSEDVYLNIAADIDKMIRQLEPLEQEIAIIPISSLKGDNVVHFSKQMDWYKGETLSTVLHGFNKKEEDTKPFRMDVQQVYHVQNENFVDYRAYAGRISSGSVKVGETLTILPSGKASEVVEVRKFTNTLDEAHTGDSIQVRLKDDIDISRGMLFVKESQEHLFAKELKARLVWLDEKAANTSAKYHIQTGSRTGVCKIQEIEYLIQPENPLEHVASHELKLNDIALVQLKLANPMYLDAFATNKANGAFILIDAQTNNTVAVGFVQ
ncbi:sulfate adenylyltransferase [Flavobacterium sp. TP390]|uniref:sulfate adenylyltransferase n=1 Tax=Flavobacterium profundi TaxID=1774945 RepID=A0A6I4IJF8_9FLAO|nr:GTP-binding protein [Flavobacterium profundi]MVO07772.1 sulfate adenylyltransferase [Flavobacterium profundi]